MQRLVRDDTGETIEFGHDSVSIGRKEALCNVRVDDQSVSALHCRVVVTKGDTPSSKPVVTIFDLESRNGTWINEKRVRTATLNHGDKVRLGSVAFTFEAIDAPATSPVATNIRKSLKALTNVAEDNDAGTVPVEPGVELRVFGTVIGPTPVTQVALSVSRGEVSPSCEARFTGHTDWSTLDVILDKCGISLDELGVSAAAADPLDRKTAPVLPALPSAPAPRTNTGPSSDLQKAIEQAAAKAGQRVSEPVVSPTKEVAATLAANPEWTRYGLMLSGVLAALAIMVHFVMGGATERLAVHGEIQGADGRDGVITFRPGSGSKVATAVGAIENGRYAFTEINGPVAGRFDVVIELEPKDDDSDKGSADGNRADPWSRPPLESCAASATVSQAGPFELNFKWAP